MLSLATAMLIWIYVVSTAEIELNKELAIQVDLPDGKAIRNEVPKSVIYRIKGPGLFVRAFLEKQNTFKIPRQTFKKSMKKKILINLEKFQDQLPLGLELVDVAPRQFYLELEASMEKTVPVKAQFAAAVLGQFKVQKLELWPKEVQIRGPRSLVQKVDFIDTKELEPLKIGLNKEVKVALINPDQRLRLSPEVVNTSIDLINKMVRKKVDGFSILFQSEGFIKYASQKKVELTLEGSSKEIEDLDLDSIQVIALAPRGKRGELDIELITELPQGIKVIDISPKSIKVIVE